MVPFMAQLCSEKDKRNYMRINSRLSCLILTMITILTQNAFAEAPAKFKHVQTQYIVALGDANANSGTGAESWGLWDKDPGPRGCSLKNYKQLEKTGVAPAQWPFDKKDWWLEEHGLIMEKPTFPLPPGKYVVTGGRTITSVLAIDPMDKNGAQHWELQKGVKLYDVTHLPCHAARYTPAADNATCSPDTVEKKAFPVASGITMPAVKGCNKKDYAVLFVIGVAEKN